MPVTVPPDDDSGFRAQPIIVMTADVSRVALARLRCGHIAHLELSVAPLARPDIVFGISPGGPLPASVTTQVPQQPHARHSANGLHDTLRTARVATE